MFDDKTYRRKYYRKHRERLKAKNRQWKRENDAKRKQGTRERLIRHIRYVTEYLLLHPCIDCGESDVRFLDFDHVRGIKTLSVAAMLSRFKLPTLIAEIAKCEVRCIKCHRIRHNKNSFVWRVKSQVVEDYHARLLTPKTVSYICPVGSMPPDESQAA